MNNLGKNLKHLRKKYKYNQIDLAKAIGVSQTSVAHYEAGTRQPSIDTLMELSKTFDEPIDMLVGNKIISKSQNSFKIILKDLIELLVDALVSKDENQFIEILDKNVYPYYEVNYMIDDVFKQVMYKIGDLWEQGIISEADEHFATNIVRKVIGYISIKKNSKLKTNKAISFTVGSEKHTLGIEMINAYLESQGINSLYLGNDLPIRSIEKVIDEFSPDYIFISITMSDSMNSLVSLIDNINNKYNSDINIIVGGQGIKENHSLSEYSNLKILKNIGELVEYIN